MVDTILISCDNSLNLILVPLIQSREADKDNGNND